MPFDPTYNSGCYVDANGGRRVTGPSGVHLITVGGRELTEAGMGTSPLGTMNPLPSAINLFEERIGHIHRSRFTFSNFAMAVTYNGANGVQGSQLLYTFPRGLLSILGVTSALTVTGDGTNISATAALVAALGSVAAAADATLTGTEADFAASYAATLAASAGVIKNKSSALRQVDNTTITNATQLALYQNIAGVQACASANGTITLNGVVDVSWYNLGDQ